MECIAYRGCGMNYNDWYTDIMEIWRVESDVTDGLTTQKRVQVADNIRCRIYKTNSPHITMKQTAADTKRDSFIMCDTSVDVKKGDELIIHRGAALGQTVPVIRGFSGEPDYYFEPFGAVLPHLAHQEILLMEQERM